jgi:hypothetical protein
VSKTYVIRRNANGVLDIYRTQQEQTRQPVPSVVNAPFSTVDSMEVIALAILLDWFADEDAAERKAVALAAGLGVKLYKLGCQRQVLFTNGKTGWDITSDELGEMVCDLLVNAGESVVAVQPTDKQVAVIEYIMGQRRDTVRQPALQETTSRRLMN